MKNFFFTAIAVCLFLVTYSQQLIPFEKNEKWGFCDISKKEIIRPKYHEVTKFNKAGFSLVSDDKGNKGVINTQGKEIIPIRYKEIYFDAHQINQYHEEEGYYGDYGKTEAQIKIERWTETKNATEDILFKREVITVKEEGEIIWFNGKGKEIYRTTEEDEIVSNYYLPGYSIKSVQDDESELITYISDKGKVIVKKMNASFVEAISYVDLKSKSIDNSIKRFYNIKREVKTEKTSELAGALYECALYNEDGKQIFGYEDKITEIKNIYQTPSGDVLAIIGKKDGGDDCNPIFKYGVYNITKGNFKHQVEYDLINRIYFDDYYGEIELRNALLRKKAIELINSDMSFESVQAFKDSVELAIELSEKEKIEARNFSVMAKDNVYDFYEKGKLIKKVKLPKNLKPNRAYYLLENGYYGYESSFLSKVQGAEKTAIIQLSEDIEGYLDGGYGRSSFFYIKIDEEDNNIYQSTTGLRVNLEFWLDSLNYKIVCVGENEFNFIDSNKKLVFSKPYNEIEISSGDNPVYYVTINDLIGVYSIYGMEIIPAKYDNLKTKKGTGVFLAELDGKSLLIDNKGNEIVPPTENDLILIKMNGEYYVQEYTEVFSRKTNKREYQIVAFYDLKGKRINGNI